MHAMIHMQIKTGMGRHIEFSEMHPQMHEESKKVSQIQSFGLISFIGNLWQKKSRRNSGRREREGEFE